MGNLSSGSLTLFSQQPTLSSTTDYPAPSLPVRGFRVNLTFGVALVDHEPP
jgi:hypothetical protein